MDAFIISSESSDDSDFEREIEEAKRRSVLDLAEERSDAAGERSCKTKETAIFHVTLQLLYNKISWNWALPKQKVCANLEEAMILIWRLGEIALDRQIKLTTNTY